MENASHSLPVKVPEAEESHRARSVPRPMRAGPAVGLAALAGVLLLPEALTRSQVTAGVLIGTYALAAVGLSFLLQAGLVSFGQAGFMGLGAYTAAILSARHGWPPLAALAAAVAVPPLVAYAIGAPILRLRGSYLGFATLALAIIAQALFTNLTPLTGGAIGLGDIPALRVGGLVVDSPRDYYTLCWSLVAILVVLLTNIARSRPGVALRSIAADERAARLVGVDAARYKLHAFAISSATAGLAGGLYASFMSYISPDAFGLLLSVSFLVMVVVGGRGSIAGAVVGAIVIGLTSQVLVGMTAGQPARLAAALQSLLYAGLIAGIVLYGRRA